MKTRRIHKKIAIIFAALVLVLLFAPTFAGAIEGAETKVTEQKTIRFDDRTNTDSQTKKESDDDTSESADDSATVNVTNRETVREGRKEVARKRLDDAKLKVCTNREGQVNTIMDRVVTRSQKHIDRITAVADKTKAFYETQGNTTDGYFGLVTTVETSRQAAQTAVDLLLTDATFSCQSDGPKSDIQQFRNQRITKITAVGTYRDAVKALIAAVKAAQPQTAPTKGQQ